MSAEKRSAKAELTIAQYRVSQLRHSLNAILHELTRVENKLEEVSSLMRWPKKKNPKTKKKP